jgi:penicillin-binding protein 1A
VIDEQTAFIMDSILKDVVRKGTATAAKKLNRNDIAGKTGTTNGPTDVWFSGYGGTITGTAWIGFDQNTNLGRKEFGGTAALPIWISFMEQALAGQPEVIHAQPAGLVTIKINPDTGNRAEPGEPDAVFEYFKAGEGPEENPASDSSGNPQQALPDDLF